MSWQPGGPAKHARLAPGHMRRDKPPANAVQRSLASQLLENESLFDTYEHLQGLPRSDSALTLLRKVASAVKPIMRKRGWRVPLLAEFLPSEQNLLGLNINKGEKICIRLRYHNNPDLFLTPEEVIDTMLHELSHNVWGEHDSNFNKLWDELRDEHEALVRKGYTGEGFLGAGQRLGTSGSRVQPTPLHVMRDRARASAEKRKAQGILTKGSGQRLGGKPLHQSGVDVRKVIADQATQRNKITKGCGSRRQDAKKLSEQSSRNTFKTKAEEDDANNRAIAQALYELIEQDEERKLNGTYQDTSVNNGGLAWSPEQSLYNAGMSMPAPNGRNPEPSEDEQMKWALQNSMQNAPMPVAPAVPLGPKPRPKTDNNANANTKGRRPESGSGAGSGLNYPASTQEPSNSVPEGDDQWVCEICTLVNPTGYLACSACGVERPAFVIVKGKAKEKTLTRPSQATMITSQPASRTRWNMPPSKPRKTLGWTCRSCEAFMEHKWWTCSACGAMKVSS